MKSVTIRNLKFLHLAAALLLLLCFFLPWVNWNGSLVRGFDFPSGRFFAISADRFQLANPYPQLDFTFFVFWAVPGLALLSIAWILVDRKNLLAAGLAGLLSLSLVTLFFLFSKTLNDLGVGRHVFGMLKWPFYLSFVSSTVLVLTSLPPRRWLKKSVWILAGPLFAWLGYLLVQTTVWNETFHETGRLKPDYIITADSLLREFATNDSAANHKYREKIVEVKGRVTSVERLADSSTSIRFEDSTGSYIIFSFDRDQYDLARAIRPADQVAARGSCSGSLHSEILGTTSISFKRSTLIKN